ncbi:MAG TPA: glutathione S-transferase family protein [Burkholderiaceae bacterium]|nr:glutathione S-transferase family protein [Burkholderiaceae bacterium]
MSLTLVIGNKNYSSWSLRPWLAMKTAGIAFDEVNVSLYIPGHKEKILRYSPSGRVPCLIDGELTVFDSLAICEYISEQMNEQRAGGSLWPREVAARAQARSVVAEMHSGFGALRKHMPMDIRSRYADKGAAAQRREDVAADVARIHAVWNECLAHGGPMLFGSFSIADAFYAPVVTRFTTYGVKLPPLLAAYAESVLALPAMQQWIAAAKAETETIEA